MKQIVVPLFLGAMLWATIGWLTHPRELWDVPAFWIGWLLATLTTGVFGLLRGAPAWQITAALFGPILPVLLVSAGLTGRDLGLFPLGLVVVAVLALPGLGLAYLAKRLVRRG